MKIPLSVLLVAFLGFIFQGFFIVSSNFGNPVLTACLKTVASIIFVTVGFLGCRRLKKSVSGNAEPECGISESCGNLICAGLFIGMLGDIFLTLRFVLTGISQIVFFIGILCFLSGHIFYLIASVPKCPHKILALLSALLISLVIVLIYVRILSVTMLFKIAGIIYVCVIAFLTSTAFINAFVSPRPQSLVFALGSLFFSVSDILLMLTAFGSVQNPIFSAITLILYYFGQMLIAFSINVSVPRLS